MAKTDFSKINSHLQKAQDRKKAFENGSSTKKFEKTEWMKLPFGDTTFMVLPPFSEESDIFLEVYIHHNFADPNDPNKKRSYQCSKKAHGSCPICEHVDVLTKSGDTKRASQFKAQRTFLYNVMDQEGNVKVAPLKPSMHTEVLQEINTNYIDNDVDVTDPYNGTLIKLSRLKAAPWARARVLGKRIELSENKITEVKTKIKDLTTVYFDFTPEDLQRGLDGDDLYPKKVATQEVSEELEETAEEVVPTQVVEKKAVAAKPAAVTPKAVVKAATPASKTAVPAAAKKVEAAKPTETPVVEEEKESTGDAELDAMLEDLDLN